MSNKKNKRIKGYLYGRINQLEQDMADLKSDHEEKIAELNSYNTKRFNDLTKLYDNTIGNLRSEKANISSAHQLEKSAWQNKYDTDINSMKTNISGLQNEVSSWKTKYEADVSSWKIKYDVDTKRLNDTVSELRNQTLTSTGSKHQMDTQSINGSKVKDDKGHKRFNPCRGLFGKCGGK